SEGAARLCRMAVIGAIWAVFFFIAPVLYFAHSVPGADYSGAAWWQMVLRVTLLPLGFSAPFGATILGWIGVVRIRRSAGKIYGLGLALFDGLLFPLLALDAALGFLWYNFPGGLQ